jgi:thioredoxin 1
VIIAKVNTDENSEWAMKYGVQGIPTMLFISKGKVVHKQVGALPEPMLRQVLDMFLSAVVVPN